MSVLFEIWFALRKYGRWSEAAEHLLKAERELLSAMVVVIRSLREAAAPYAKEDAFAALTHEVFHFFERAMQALMPSAGSTSTSVELKETQRRALLAIRDVLLDERTAVTVDAAQGKYRGEVIDAILTVIDRELLRIEEPDQDDTAAEEMADGDELVSSEKLAVESH